jgi:AraC-like DNA-binding protein
MDTVTTSGMTAGEREPFWRYAMGEIFVPVTIDRVSGGRYGGSIRSGSIGRMMVAEVTASGQHIEHTESHTRQASEAYLQVALVADGVGRVSQDGRQAELHPGDCAVYETIRPFEWHFEDAWDVWVFTFPVGSVALSESERRNMTARRLDGQAGLTGVVSRFLLDLGRNSEALSGAHSERVISQASDLVVTLLSGAFDDDDVTRGSVQRTLMLQIKDYIDQRLADPRLRPDEIAAAVNISTRYLHKLFQDERRSVSQYVKEHRLDRARRDLLDPRLAQRAISAIAFGWGFGDLSGFNRAFKDAYGISPSEMRSGHAMESHS